MITVSHLIRRHSHSIRRHLHASRLRQKLFLLVAVLSMVKKAKVPRFVDVADAVNIYGNPPDMPADLTCTYFFQKIDCNNGSSDNVGWRSFRPRTGDCTTLFRPRQEAATKIKNYNIYSLTMPWFFWRLRSSSWRLSQAWHPAGLLASYVYIDAVCAPSGT